MDQSNLHRIIRRPMTNSIYAIDCSHPKQASEVANIRKTVPSATLLPLPFQTHQSSNRFNRRVPPLALPVRAHTTLTRRNRLILRSRAKAKSNRSCVAQLRPAVPNGLPMRTRPRAIFADGDGTLWRARNEELASVGSIDRSNGDTDLSGELWGWE